LIVAVPRGFDFRCWADASLAVANKAIPINEKTSPRVVWPKVVAVVLIFSSPVYVDLQKLSRVANENEGARGFFRRNLEKTFTR
jgi:hypothetical protein